MAERWQQDLDKLAQGLQQAAGANLSALLLYGSAARPGDHGPRADVNVLVIVRDAATGALRPMATALAGWVKAGYPPPLVFSEGEWRGSADVFPIEIEDMRAAHRLVLGSDPFAGLTTDRADLRRELEREVRSKLLHLRTAYAAAAPRGKDLEALLEQSSGTILTLLRAALRVAGLPVPPDPAAQVAGAARLTGFDAAAFDWVLARRSGATAGGLGPYDVAAAAYVDAVQRLADWVDTQ